MQNDPHSSPDSAEPDFSQSAAINASTRIAIQLQKTGNKWLQQEHKERVARQKISYEHKLKEQREQRAGLIDTLTRTKLREATEGIHPDLKPEQLSESEYAIRERAARAEAVAQVGEIERTALEEMDHKFLADQRFILERAMSGHARQQFNEQAREGLKLGIDDPSQSKGGRSL